MKILITITDENHSYTENLSMENMLEYYCEIVGNQANPYMYGVSFDHWTRKIGCNVNDVKKFNTKDGNCHFIFGWLEDFLQGNDVPDWILENYSELQIDVARG